MGFTKKESFIKQLLFYYSRKEYDLAFPLSKEFIATFPKSAVSHFFLAKTAFMVQNYTVAIEAARNAFTLSQGNDIITTGVLLSSVYYLAGELEKGYKVLQDIQSSLGGVQSQEYEQLLSLYCIAFNNPSRALEHTKKLYEINSRYADDFVLRFLL